MQVIWEKLYYRVQCLFVFLQKKLISRKLNLLPAVDYRVDLLRTLQPIRGWVEYCDVFIDIGANKGEFAQIFSDIYQPEMVVCVEPNEELNEFILANNRKLPVIINKAISDCETEMVFYFHPDSQMSSLFPGNDDLLKRDFGEDDPKGITRKKIPVTTLDILFSQYGEVFIHKTIFLKIDTQGNELDVLKGGKKALAMVRYCLLEYMFQSPYEKQYPFEEIIGCMAENGFACLGPVHVSYRSTGQTGAVLFLFSRKDNTQLNPHPTQHAKAGIADI
jgi:FkbM family methyltransferase